MYPFFQKLLNWAGRGGGGYQQICLAKKKEGEGGIKRNITFISHTDLAHA